MNLDPAIVVVTIGSLTTIIVTLMSLRQSRINTEKTEKLEKKADASAVVTTHIEHLTNSATSELKAELKEAKEQIKAINESNKVMQSLIMTFMERDSRPPAVVAAVIAAPPIAAPVEPITQTEKLHEIATTGEDTNIRVTSIQEKVEAVEEVQAERLENEATNGESE